MYILEPFSSSTTGYSQVLSLLPCSTFSSATKVKRLVDKFYPFWLAGLVLIVILISIQEEGIPIGPNNNHKIGYCDEPTAKKVYVKSQIVAESEHHTGTILTEPDQSCVFCDYWS
jgi:hypothetical protein